MRLTALPREIGFWDLFAPYYEAWAQSTAYHKIIMAELSLMVERNWKVLDIGAATGRLSIPLSSLGCHVTAVEPSSGMREILIKKLSELNVHSVEIIPQRWEDCNFKRRFDLILASNSLHLVKGGLLEGAKKVFAHAPDYFCLITEIETFPIDFKIIDDLAEGYEFLYIKTYEVDCSLCPETEKAILTLLKNFTPDTSSIGPKRTKLSILWWEREDPPPL